MNWKVLTSVASVGLVWLLLTAGCQQEERQIQFGGGPAGGTFHRFAAGLAGIVEETAPDTDIIVHRSGGSLANLRNVNRGEIDMALVYAGDAYLGWAGRLEPNTPPMKDVRAVTRLYGAPAHLAVLKDSPFRFPEDLKGKAVAIGGPGSGAAVSAERFFRSLGLWEQIVPVHLGYSIAMDELNRGAVQAVWQLVGVPSVSLSEMGRKKPLRMLDLYDVGRTSGLFDTYPFYTPAVIPQGTYPGQRHDIRTFQEAALWVVGSRVDEALLYRALKHLYSPEGLKRMRRAHSVAGDLKIEKGLLGVEIPLAPGAEKYWREQGLPAEPPDHLQSLRTKPKA